MSEVLGRTRFVPARATPRDAAPHGATPPPPLIAVLCRPARARVSAAGLALALARAHGSGYALASVLGEVAGGSSGAMPGAHRAAVALRSRGSLATAGGRLVRLSDRRGPLDDDDDDVVARAAALSADVGRAAIAVGAPATVAFPLARTAALDRVLAWHDAIVVVREHDVAPGVVERALAGLAELGRPVAELVAPRRSSGVLAVMGLAAPPEARAALACLALDVGSGDA